MLDFNLIDSEFKKYVSNFNFDDEKISLKYYHTLEVANICYEVAESLGLSNEDKDLAKLIGYLHDIGRFEQVATTNSFKDKELDHADNGVRILFEEGLIRRFIQEDKYDEIIKKAVRNHNKYKILDPVNDREELFANIIRDSDKIDIFRVRTKYYHNEMKLVPTPKIVEEVKQGHSINLNDIKNKSDSILCVMAFIFDFNYKESLRVLKKKGYYNDFLNSIEVSDENMDTFNEIKEQLLKKLEV